MNFGNPGLRHATTRRALNAFVVAALIGLTADAAVAKEPADRLTEAWSILARENGVVPERFRVDPAAIEAEDAAMGGMRLAAYLREQPWRAAQTLEGMSGELIEASEVSRRLSLLSQWGRIRGEVSLPPLSQARKFDGDTASASPSEAAMLQLFQGTGKRFQGKDRARFVRETGTLPPAVNQELARILIAVTAAGRTRDDVVDASLLKSGGLFDSKSRKTAALLHDFLGAWWDGNPDREHGFRELAPVLQSVDLEMLTRGGINLAGAVDSVGTRLGAMPSGSFDAKEFQFQWDTPLGRIAVGGTGENRFDGDFAAVLDLGGDDRYRGPGATNGREPVGIVLDLGGDDRYEGPDSAAAGPGGAILGYAGVMDLGRGKDVYASQGWSQGFAFLGVGWIRDEGGNDRYRAYRLAQGAAVYGLGLLVDEAGDDAYDIGADESGSIRGHSQGFGGPRGCGALVDLAGADTYRFFPFVESDGPTLGAAWGIEPWCAGGLGLLVEGGGNDHYASYRAGSGTHSGLGALVDRGGNDRYDIERGLGVGSKFGLGVFLELAGDDTCAVGDGSLGVGKEMGTGIAIDTSGDDGYHFGDRSLGAGIAEGAGFFLELGGEDTYQGKGACLGVVFDGTDRAWRVPTEAIGAAIDLEQSKVPVALLGRSMGPWDEPYFTMPRGDAQGLGGALFLPQTVKGGNGGVGGDR